MRHYGFPEYRQFGSTFGASYGELDYEQNKEKIAKMRETLSPNINDLHRGNFVGHWRNRKIKVYDYASEVYASNNPYASDSYQYYSVYASSSGSSYAKIPF